MFHAKNMSFDFMPSREDHLSWRESQMVYFCLCGFSRNEMADSSGLSIRTVEGHLKTIKEKWKVSSNYSIILEAIKKGDIDQFLAFHSSNVKRTNRVLSRRQVQVLKYLFKGYSHHDIAVKLGISDRTVPNHVSVIKEKFNLKSEAEIVYMTIIGGYLVVRKMLPMQYQLYFVEPIFEMKENYTQKYVVTDDVVSMLL
jgi:DNA-binding NarL/FixJ family response regulator